MTVCPKAASEEPEDGLRSLFLQLKTERTAVTFGPAVFFIREAMTMCDCFFPCLGVRRVVNSPSAVGDTHAVYMAKLSMDYDYALDFLDQKTNHTLTAYAR